MGLSERLIPLVLKSIFGIFLIFFFLNQNLYIKIFLVTFFRFFEDKSTHAWNFLSFLWIDVKPSCLKESFLFNRCILFFSLLLLFCFYDYDCFFLKNVSVAENAEKKIWIQLWNNKYFYGTFNSNFSLQNKQLQHLSSSFETPRKN